MVAGIPGIRSRHLIRLRRVSPESITERSRGLHPIRILAAGEIGVGDHALTTTRHNALAIGIAVLALAASAGCSALRADYSSWEGHPTSELLSSWGEPDSTEELGSDYVAHTWMGDDGVCQRTFMSRAGTITGYSESDC